MPDGITALHVTIGVLKLLTVISPLFIVMGLEAYKESKKDKKRVVENHQKSNKLKNVI